MNFCGFLFTRVKPSININLLRTAGTRIASDGLKGRVYEVSLADLQNENDAERSFRKFKLVCEEVQVYKSVLLI